MLAERCALRGEALDDHEGRIRLLEAHREQQTGRSAAIGALVGVVASLCCGMIVWLVPVLHIGGK